MERFLDVAMTIVISIGLIFCVGVVAWLCYMGINYGIQYSKASYVVADGENTYFVNEILSHDGDAYTMKCTDGSILTVYNPSIKEK